MSLAELNELNLSWTLRNTLTINNDVSVEGDLNLTGAIYDGGLPVTITGLDNVWTGNNMFQNFQPTFLDPVADEDMTTFDYMDNAFSTPYLGSTFLPLNNSWTGSNMFQECPTLNNLATVGTNEMVNLNTLNAYLATDTGQLGTVNTWTGTNTFTNKVIVPTPVTLAQFGNKKYVDDEIAAFNAAGGNIEYQEILSQNGSTAITLDPATYTGMYVCIVGKGGNGAIAGTVPIPGNTGKSFGGAGGYACFKLPAFTGAASLEVATIQSGWSYFYLNGVQLAGASAGLDGDNGASGDGGGSYYFAGLSGGQNVIGSVETYQLVANPAINYSYNSAVLNGYGQGGSYVWANGTTVAPTGFYCLLIKFKK